MYLEQFFLRGIAHSSYLLGDGGVCAIIDPRRDVQVYIDAAAALNMTITHVLETHLHADFISGHLDLAKSTGARIHAPGSAGSHLSALPFSKSSLKTSGIPRTF